MATRTLWIRFEIEKLHGTDEWKTDGHHDVPLVWDPTTCRMMLDLEVEVIGYLARSGASKGHYRVGSPFQRIDTLEEDRPVFVYDKDGIRMQKPLSTMKITVSGEKNCDIDYQISIDGENWVTVDPNDTRLAPDSIYPHKRRVQKGARS